MLKFTTSETKDGPAFDLLSDIMPRGRACVANGVDTLVIDAGTRHVRLQAYGPGDAALIDTVFSSTQDVREKLLAGPGAGLLQAGEPRCVVITGKLASAVQERLGAGKQVLPVAAFWLAAQDLMRAPENDAVDSLAIIDLSASGYLLIGVDREGNLKDDLLATNPRCGAGSGMNLDRVLQKLDVAHEDVDMLLEVYLGDAGRARREAAAVRVDRCGVFSTSATISDKNQGIPLDVALATTLKSEVLKTVRRLPPGFGKVYLTGRIFRWQYARECAEDVLRASGISLIEHDPENTQILRSLRALVKTADPEQLAQADASLGSTDQLEEYPAFTELRRRYESSHHYRRMPPQSVAAADPADLADVPLILALDVGSTMVKVVLADARSGRIVFLDAYSNAGDTMESLNKVFRDLQAIGIERLALQCVGVTGSARYQVQQALSRIYPGLADRVSVLVENYAHARGSIDQAREHIRWLEARGVRNLEKRRCVLVDIGGEDTKISTIALEEAELFDNAMNTKCSAGTGSLMDTLSAMFGLESAAEAQARAYEARRSFAINATCAVFLMENASKLQARGVPRDEILASANWAIVENMARTLWRQLDLPGNAVVLLHGQTMLSDPLPLAVTHRLQSYLGAEVYALVPPDAGHRACMGLIRTLRETAPQTPETVSLGDLLKARFEKRLIQCKGAVCGDALARCNRCALRWEAEDGRKIAFTVGGCTAINEVISRKGRKQVPQPRDAYQEIWNFVDGHHPRSDDPQRLVIPRSFVVSDWAYFLSRIFEQLGIPVHVDNVRDTDLTDAQPHFSIDCCAPQMGAVGQYRRLAGEPHGMILAPQIQSLPTGGSSHGLTCSANQGGVAVARNLAGMARPEARFHLFRLSLDDLEGGNISDQLLEPLKPVFRRYGVTPDAASLERIIDQARDDHLRLRRQSADLAAELAHQAVEAGGQLALVVGREYILNPRIYDSHVRRLLRERGMTVIPSYVLDVDLDPDYASIYWRNAHFILTVLKAVAHRNLHRCVRHAGLKSVLRRIERDPSGALLPVVQVSTFSCGPDSVITHYVAEIMKERPFLLIQSDAVLKELAHLENRVNTYVKQLEQGLHERLAADNGELFEIGLLDRLIAREPLNRETDVICLPTLGDNRSVTAVLRGAGFTCLENYDAREHDLEDLVRTGREAAGQAVCAPLAAIYADLQRGVEEFVRRKQAGDPALAGKRRLLLIDSQGPGPCRQGQYPGLHRLFFHRWQGVRTRDPASGNARFEFLVLDEGEGYQGDFEDWTMLRIYQGVILKCILQELLFKGGAACRDQDEYARFLAAYRTLQTQIYAALASYAGPGPFARRMLRLLGERSWISIPLKYFVYRLHGREFLRPLRQFVSTWIKPRSSNENRLDILITGEGYMRLAQAEKIFETLLGAVGFRQFNLEISPVLSFLELLLEEVAETSRTALAETRARRARAGEDDTDEDTRGEKRRLQTVKLMRFLLRQVLARPLYRASGLNLPPSVQHAVETARELIPTYRPFGELAPYVGEVILALRKGTDLVLNVAPSGCVVASMGEVLSPRILQAGGLHPGRIQTLLSADGDVNEEVLTIAMLKAMGPQRYCRMSARGST